MRMRVCAYACVCVAQGREIINPGPVALGRFWVFLVPGPWSLIPDPIMPPHSVSSASPDPTRPRSRSRSPTRIAAAAADRARGATAQGRIDAWWAQPRPRPALPSALELGLCRCGYGWGLQMMWPYQVVHVHNLDAPDHVQPPAGYAYYLIRATESDRARILRAGVFPGIGLIPASQGRLLSWYTPAGGGPRQAVQASWLRGLDGGLEQFVPHSPTGPRGEFYMVLRYHVDHPRWPSGVSREGFVGWQLGGRAIPRTPNKAPLTPP